MPPPYQPITGERETLRAKGKHPYCAMFQVAAVDNYSTFVRCRGYDTRDKKYYDYDADDLDNKPGISVAKPYGKRHVGLYQIGEIYPAVLPICWLDYYPAVYPGGSEYQLTESQNPGRVQDGRVMDGYWRGDHCRGQPIDLQTRLMPIADHNAKYINWLLLDSGPAFLWAYLEENLYTCSTARASTMTLDEDGKWCIYDQHVITASDPFGVVAGSALAQVGPSGTYIPTTSTVLVMGVSDPDTSADQSDEWTCQWAAVTFGLNCCGEY